MRLLLDHCVPHRFGRALIGHSIATAVDMKWELLRNGDLLRAAAAAGFDAVITVDQNWKYQQNLDELPVAVVVVRSISNDIADLLRLAPLVLAALDSLRARQLIEVSA